MFHPEYCQRIKAKRLDKWKWRNQRSSGLFESAYTIKVVQVWLCVSEYSWHILVHCFRSLQLLHPLLPSPNLHIPFTWYSTWLNKLSLYHQCTCCIRIWLIVIDLSKQLEQSFYCPIVLKYATVSKRQWNMHMLTFMLTFMLMEHAYAHIYLLYWFMLWNDVCMLVKLSQNTWSQDYKRLYVSLLVKTVLNAM